MQQDLRDLTWFTHTNIDTSRFNKKNGTSVVKVDLTKYIEKFINKKIWNRPAYSMGYPETYLESDLKKIKSILVDFHSDEAPYSNAHSYEKIISLYHSLERFESRKISSSDIQNASQIAVFSVTFQSEYDVMEDLSLEEEKDLEIVFEKYLSDTNIYACRELNAVKSIVFDFLQFLRFSLHLAFPSKDYSFKSTDNHYQSGLIVVTDGSKTFCETSKIDLLGHYIYYEDESHFNAILDFVSEIWCLEIPSINFYLSSLQGSYINVENFSRLVYTIESFFGKNISTDFMKLSISILIGLDFKDVEHIKKCLSESFVLRNDYVHGGRIPKMHEFIPKNEDKNVWDLFFELKNIATRLFHFFISNKLYTQKTKQFINDDLVMKFYFDRINKKQTNKAS